MSEARADNTDREWVLVTGGTRGIGRGLVTALSAAGYDTVFTFQHSVDMARALEAQLAESPGRAQGIQCDCSDSRVVGDLAATLLRDRGPPHAIVNNVGVTRDVPMMRMGEHEWHDVIANNLDSSFYVTRNFVGAMVERGRGVILQMSSVTGIKGNVGQTNYGASKAGMIGMTKSLALELSRFNIRVNAVVPGFIATEMVDQISENQQAAIKRSIPLRRFGTVKEVASLCLYLVSDEAAYMTGQIFVIDGGVSV